MVLYDSISKQIESTDNIPMPQTAPSLTRQKRDTCIVTNNFWNKCISTHFTQIPHEETDEIYSEKKKNDLPASRAQIIEHRFYKNAGTFERDFDIFFDSITDGQCGVNALLQIKNLLNPNPDKSSLTWPSKNGESSELTHLRQELVQLQKASMDLKIIYEFFSGKIESRKY